MRWLIAIFAGLALGVVILSATSRPAFHSMPPSMPGWRSPGGPPAQLPGPPIVRPRPTAPGEHIIRLAFLVLGLALILWAKDNVPASSLGAMLIATVATLYLGPLIK